MTQPQLTVYFRAGSQHDPRSMSEDLLSLLSQRASARLGADEQAQAYLRGQGVADETVWQTYRIGATQRGFVDDAQTMPLREAGILSRKGPNPFSLDGILFPTCDPTQPDLILGLVRIANKDNKHGFITAPTGLGVPANLQFNAPLVIVDNPILTLRMAQAGVPNAVLAETPEVLESLRAWLRGWEIVLVSCKKRCLENLKNALGDELAERCRTMLVPSYARSFNPDTFRSEREPALASELLIHRLAQYAQEQLRNGYGAELLRELGADVPALADAYGMGYLPAGFQDALPENAREALANRVHGNCVLIPALDETQAIVDVLMVRMDRGKPIMVGLLAEPAGLLAPRVVTANAEIVVTDSFSVTARLWASGARNVLLLRGVADCEANAERLYACGVRTAAVAVRRTKVAERIVEALNKAGIDASVQKVAKRTADVVPPMANDEVGEAEPVVVPEPPKVDATADIGEILPSYPTAPTLVSHDAKAEEAVFTAKDATYRVEVPLDGAAKVEIRLERDGRIAVDRFDLAVEAQRKRFGKSAALRTAVPFDVIEEHLLHIHDELKRLMLERLHLDAPKKIAVEVSKEECEEAVAFLKKPDLLDAIAADLEALGWVGEERNKRLLYLASISRRLEVPLSVALRAPSGSGKSHGIEMVALLTPPEDVIHVSRLSEGSLYYQRDALKHKLFVIDEADALTQEVMVALRVLQSRGALSHSMVARDEVSGATVTQFGEAEGPVAVLTSTTKDLEPEFLSRCYDLSVDDSEEQTARILEIQRRLRADAAHAGNREAIVARHHALQRVLETRPVVVPFADRIIFPSNSIRFRREQERFLNLIGASALLHQHQRMRDGEAVVADERDFTLARDLASDLIARAADELPRDPRDVLDAVRRAKATAFTMADLKRMKPDWSRHRLLKALAELQRVQLAASPRCQRGKAREYLLNPEALGVFEAPQVTLAPVGKSDNLSNLLNPSATTHTPSRATG